MITIAEDEFENIKFCQKIVTKEPKKVLISENRHLRNDMELQSEDGKYKYFVFIRINEKFKEDFSIGLRYIPIDRKSVELLRFNGPHEPEIIDNNPHFKPHIHYMKFEDYNVGRRRAKHKKETFKYRTYEEAIRYFINY